MSSHGILSNFIRMGQPPDSFSFIFGLSESNNAIFTKKIMLKMSIRRIRRQDGNSQSIDYEYPSLSTTPGLPPK